MAKVKGTNFIGLVKVLRTHRERALAVLPPALYRLSGRAGAAVNLVSGGRLSRLADGHGVGDSARRHAVLSDGATVRPARSRRHLQESPEGGRPAAHAHLGAGVVRSYHDTGELRSEPEGPRTALVEWRNYPECTKQLCSGTRGYVTEMVVLSGGKNVRLVELSCRADKHHSVAGALRGSEADIHAAPGLI